MLGRLFLLASIVASSVNADVVRGVTWAVDNRWATPVGQLPLIKWYHHWADGPVPEMGTRAEFVPMFWGPKNTAKWNQRVAEMNKKKPNHIMAFNEPDLSGQANMNPYYAAELFMQQIHPWRAKGVRVGSPAIAYNMEWMATFLAEVKKRGGAVDFLCIHWYGSHKDIAGFKKFVTAVRTKFNKQIWVTELGITSSSNPSQNQVKSFLIGAVTWMDSQPYIERFSWFGCFLKSNPPDGFATGFNGLFAASKQLADMAYWLGYTKSSASTVKRSVDHSSLARRLTSRLNSTSIGDDDDVVDYGVPKFTGEVTDCDELCQLRNGQLDTFDALVKRGEFEVWVD
jgi:hypothetical protein